MSDSLSDAPHAPHPLPHHFYVRPPLSRSAPHCLHAASSHGHESGQDQAGGASAPSAAVISGHSVFIWILRSSCSS
eukprot:CAMPEP_0196741502 /NCGR_PEP_ID=MMETSP1091-20130531/40712_1 /TAXON_ID=302021 /ORGANISM="Rhodomonas sp., Strain CCMP768" /LENGTH=75 /DNA_ID=CAMNT_0042087235 /DNA_START=29 /DNA_END=253 /DNA_ORIENTATION=+